MTTRDRLQVSVKWGSRQIVEISFSRFEVSWLKEAIVCGLLVHIQAKINSNLCLDNADEINVTVMHHIDECDSSGVSRKRPYVKTIATSLLDAEVYDVMMNVSTRQFDFIVKIRESMASKEGFSNAFQVLFSSSRSYVELPPPRVTANNTAVDILHNDILYAL